MLRVKGRYMTTFVLRSSRQERGYHHYGRQSCSNATLLALGVNGGQWLSVKVSLSRASNASSHLNKTLDGVKESCTFAG